MQNVLLEHAVQSLEQAAQVDESSSKKVPAAQGVQSPLSSIVPTQVQLPSLRRSKPAAHCTQVFSSMHLEQLSPQFSHVLDVASKKVSLEQGVQVPSSSTVPTQSQLPSGSNVNEVEHSEHVSKESHIAQSAEHWAQDIDEESK